MAQQRRMVRIGTALEVTGESRTGFYRKISVGLVPKPVSIGERAVAWPSDELDALNAARIAGKTPDEIRELVKRLEAARKTAVASRDISSAA